MVRFLIRRFFFIIVVSFCIVYFVQLGVLSVERSAEFIHSQTVPELLLTAGEGTLDFFSRAFRGDFGSYDTVGGARQVNEVLAQALPASLGLLLISFIVSVAFGLPLGIWVALKRKGGLTFSVLTLTMLGISIPSFFLAMLLQQGVIAYFVAFDKRILSVAGYGWDYRHLLLPVIVLSARPIAYLMRTSHIGLERVLQEDYIRTAYAKGLPGRAVVFIHALRNVGVPLLTAAGVSLRFSLAVLPIVEYLFGWPGLGLRLLQGISNSQADLAMTFALILGLLLMFGNLLLDLGYRYIDPRLRDIV